MGGQGGGVLADWIVALAEAQGWAAQSTSVPGVAQRTGATIYYIEMAAAAARAARRSSSLMPTPGDVDVVMAAELMEAGRSMLRGLVTPDRTTLIASTHRAFAVAEKETPGDGVARSGRGRRSPPDFAAKRVIAFDMEALAKAKGSVISADDVRRARGVRTRCRLRAPRSRRRSAPAASGVEPSLTRLRRRLRSDAAPSRSSRSGAFRRSASTRWPERAGHAELDRIWRAHPLDVSRRRAADAVRPARASSSTISIPPMRSNISTGSACSPTLDRAQGGEAKGFAFTVAAAKYVAVAMAYDDVAARRRSQDPRRRGRRACAREVGAAADTIVDDDRIFSSARRRALRLAAQGAGRVDRGAARHSFARLTRLVDRGPPDPDQHGHRLSHARCGRGLGAAPRAARCATRARRRIARPG